jgi:hypothetical protein
VKLPTNRAAIFGSLLCGAVVSAVFGLSLGWVLMQLVLVGVLWLLQGAASQPRRAAGLAAAFLFAFQRLEVRATGHGPKLTQSGQIMAPAIVLVLISCGLFYLMINSSQAINEKTRVTNAADAAAYSAGVVEARALNYYAYTNRAMVANQIVIAQMVSFASWMRYFGTAVDSLPAAAWDMLVMLQPDWDAARLQATFAATNAVLTSGGLSGQALADAVLAAAGAGVTLNDAVVHDVLSSSQLLVQLNLSAGLRQQQIASNVVREMDPGLSAQIVPTSHGFDAFTRRYSRDSRGEERGRSADVILRSRDAFTSDRSWTIRGPGGFPWNQIRRDAALKKRGGTDLVSFDEWRAMDTLELHGRRRRGFFGGWRRDIQRPIGWGAVNVNQGVGNAAGRGFHGNAYGENPRTAGIAETTMVQPPQYNFRGLPGSQELSNLDANAGRTTGITIAVSKQQASLLTSGGRAQARPSGQLAMFDARPAGGQMMSLSRAEVFFDRVDTRAGNRTEIGSLHNPYWRVRLVAVTAADRSFSAAQQGGLLLP